MRLYVEASPLLFYGEGVSMSYPRPLRGSNGTEGARFSHVVDNIFQPPDWDLHFAVFAMHLAVNCFGCKANTYING